MALRRPVARHTRATAALEFGRDDLDKVPKPQRQKNAKGRKPALTKPVSAARKHHQHSPDTTTTKPERPVSVAEAEDQPQNSLDSDSVDPPTTIPDADPELVIGRLPRRSLTPQSTSSDTETLDAYYKRTGYLPPLSESTLEVLRQVLADPSMGSTAGRLVSDRDQQVGLNCRNVNWYSTPDDFCKAHPLLQARTITILESEMDENKRWNDDLRKCKDDPQELVFQRTVMMSMVNRHRFIYGEDGVLDFAVERPWSCLPMPTRALRKPGGKYLPMPRPDIAIAFRTTALMDIGDYQNLPDPLWTLVCYEGETNAHQLRAFHFLIIESKNAHKSVFDPGSLCQVLNSASQSLHNMYEFFNEAGPKHLTRFFNEVRVFTAVSTTEGIIIRVHRACLTRDFRKKAPLRQDCPSTAPKVSILPDYPLQFEYDIYFKAHATDFTHELVSAALETIMIKYGAGILLGLLKDAAKDVVKKFANQEEHRSQHYYSHHQKAPANGGKGKGKFDTSDAGRASTQQSTSAPSRASAITVQSSSHELQVNKSYRANIEAMHKFDEENRSRIESDTEDGSLTPTGPTWRQTAGPDPNASLSENFGRAFNVEDSTRSDVEQPGPATTPTQSDALPPRRPVGKRRELPPSEITEDQPPAHNTRAKRSKK